ncbi:indole-3-glycerol phosphate synthase TrpC [Flavobacteriaceae bacterium 3-367]|uniref:indole-3-glycerol phosphate synthase TrpC n=1 Tax=Eudoraea algarum TaxID=3417568 RepID=UPI003293CCF2
MNILEKIVRDKRREVALKKELIPISQLEHSILFQRKSHSLATALRNSKTGIIAEHKRRSPSKAVINQALSVHDVARGYENAGVSGMSVLTDGKYFGGSLDDLTLARAAVQLPLLRKEFIIDPYQVLEAKAYGADVVLLITAILETAEIKELSEFAQSLGLEVLLEVHNLEELRRSLLPSVDMLGVNNRNLKTFEVSLETSKSLSASIPEDFVKVSESGIGNVEAIKELRPFGYQGFLIGENFMKASNPGEGAEHFITQLNTP